MQRKWKIGIIGTLLFLAGGSFFANAEIGHISLSILPGFLIIGNSGSITLPSIISGTTYSINQSLSNIFMLEDKIGSSTGYYSTIQTSNLQYLSNIISNAHISIQTLPSPQKLLGKDNPYIFFGNGIHNQTGSLQSPQTYFYRNTNPANHGLIGRYGDTPNLNIQVPANQAPGTYKGTIYYLLFDKNDQ